MFQANSLNSEYGKRLTCTLQYKIVESFQQFLAQHLQIIPFLIFRRPKIEIQFYQNFDTAALYMEIYKMQVIIPFNHSLLIKIHLITI